MRRPKVLTPSLTMMLAFAMSLACACDTGSTAAPQEGAVAQPTKVVAASVPPRLDEVTPDDLEGLIRRAPGRVLLVNVWSTWCAPCVEEFPMLVALGNEYRARGVGTLFISADFREQRADALRFLVAQGVAMPGYVKEGRDQAFIAAVHPDWTGTLPATILLDANRRRRHFFEGEVSRSTLESAIAELLAEREEEEQ